MANKQIIESYYRTRRSGPLDQHGIDFIATVNIHGRIKKKYFGISCSTVRCTRSEKKHNIPQLCISINDTTKTVYEKLVNFLLA